MTPPAQPLAKDLKAIENFIYSTMNHTPEWKAAEQAYQNILNTRSRPAPAAPRIGKLSDAELDEIAEESYRQITGNQPPTAPAPPEPTEYYITHDINCEYSSTITVTSHEKPEKIDVQTVKVGGITICFDSEIESIETMEDIERRINNGVQ